MEKVLYVRKKEFVIHLKRALMHFRLVTYALDGLEPAGFARTTSLFPKVKSDPVRLLFGPQYVDVESDEELADARRRCAPTRYPFCWTEIWFPFRFSEL